MKLPHLAFLIALGALALAIPRPAAAQSACTGPSCPCDQLTNPVYVQAGDTQTNLLNALGRKLRDNAPNPITLVFITSGSCTNIQESYACAGGLGSAGCAALTATMTYIPSAAEVPGWALGSADFTCTPPANTFPDIDNSAVFNSACTTAAPPSNVSLQSGPIQAYVMSTPTLSDQTAITAEEAYFVFGFGAAGMISPWTMESEMFIRTVTKSTLITWADSIGVPPGKWIGSAFAQSAQVVSALEGAPTPENAIGILGDEVYDGLRGQVNVLAYRAYGQYGAYYPDSTLTSHDKQNIRDGHYFVWSPTEYMEYINPATGSATNPNADYVIDLIVGKESSATPAPNFVAANVVASVGLVPDCAMGVQRSFDGGPLSLYSPPQSCLCSYSNAVGADTQGCTTCSANNPCATGVCRAGYCEKN